MHDIFRIHGSSAALLTDLYELTMAYGYWKTGADTKEAVFNLFFRENPFHGGFSIACGLGYVAAILDGFRFEQSDIGYLKEIRGSRGKHLFEDGFLDYLSSLKLTCDIDAIPEGTVVFPGEPLVRVTGPLLQCQLLETILLNIINFQTLIATKAARVCDAANGETVLEFGLRRAQGFDGGLTASRAAYIGGCAGTSNVLAGKLFGIPVRGTHAHSWVMSFDTELESFMAYAGTMPDNCIFLVDTYDTLEGVRNAVEVGKWLRGKGHEMVGIRLDSGDIDSLARKARGMLDEAGFADAVIVGSNELDEYRIEALKSRGSPVSVWGVGTRLVTAYDNPALGGVYKLSAVRRVGEPWQYKIKLSEEQGKTTIPGILQVRRYSAGGRFAADVLYDGELGIGADAGTVQLIHDNSRFDLPNVDEYTDLLAPVFRKGACVYSSPPLDEIRARAGAQRSQLPDAVRRIREPERYPVGLEKNLARFRERLVDEKEARNS